MSVGTSRCSADWSDQPNDPPSDQPGDQPSDQTAILSGWLVGGSLTDWFWLVGRRVVLVATLRCFADWAMWIILIIQIPLTHNLKF